MISVPLGFFIPGFPKLMRFQEHHDRILKKMMPKLKSHLVRPAERTHTHTHSLGQGVVVYK